MFLYNTYVKYRSYKKCARKFRRRFPHAPVPNVTTVYKYVKRFRATGSVLDTKRSRRRHVLTVEKLDEIGARLETSPRKSLAQLAQETGVSESSARNAVQLLHERPYEITLVHKLNNTDREARRNFVNWYLHGVHAGEIDPTLILFSGEAWFHLGGLVNSQNNRYWSAENPMLIQEVPLHGVQVGVWCAMSATRIIGPIFFSETLNSHRYVTQILTPFFERLSDYERTYAFFQQDNASSRTANNSVRCLQSVFGDRIISRGLWPPYSPDLNPCDFYLWPMLRDKVYGSNPHSEDDLKERIQNVVFSVSTAELQHVMNNLFDRCDACLLAEGDHFQQLL